MVWIGFALGAILILVCALVFRVLSDVSLCVAYIAKTYHDETALRLEMLKTGQQQLDDLRAAREDYLEKTEELIRVAQQLETERLALRTGRTSN